MTFDQLREVVTAAQAKGHRRLRLVMSRAQPPKNWSRCLVFPGVRGTVVWETEPGRYLVDVDVSDVQKLLERADALAREVA